MVYPLISIIVPVYKVPLYYLKACIDSCINQTYPNFEIILVDDGSPDDCGKICDDYASRNKRIYVIHKANGGVSDARNCGLANSHGEYISFVDGDDSVSPEYLTSLYNLIFKYKCDISITDFYSHYGKIKCVDNPSKVREYLYSGVEAVNEMFYQGFFDDSPWGKLYSKDLFKGIQYPRGIIYEDTCVTYKLMLRCEKVVFSNIKTYYYLIREDSYEGAPFSEFKLDSCFQTFKIIEEDEETSKIQHSYRCKMVSLAFHLLLKAPSGYPRTDDLWKRIKYSRLSVILDRKARYKTRVACIISYGGINALKYFFKLVDKRTVNKYSK